MNRNGIQENKISLNVYGSREPERQGTAKITKFVLITLRYFEKNEWKIWVKYWSHEYRVDNGNVKKFDLYVWGRYAHK